MAKKRDCTNCGYGIWWSYGHGFTHLYEPSPLFESLGGRCMWPLYNKKIAAKLPPMYSMAAFSYSLESPPEKDCPAWKPEKISGSAPRWGEMLWDWNMRMDADYKRFRQEAAEKRQAEILENPEAWKRLARIFREKGADSLAEDIERLLPESFEE